jgi:beta-lactamase class A
MTEQITALPKGIVVPKKQQFDIRRATAMTRQSIDALLQGATRETLRKRIAKVLPVCAEAMGGAEISVSFYDLNGTLDPFDIRGNLPGWSASTIKVPVMIAVCNEVSAGKIDYKNKLVIDHKYPLEPDDTVTLMPKGSRISVGKLLYYMITESDNEATNMLADLVGLEAVNEAARQLGAERTMLAHLLAPKVPRLRADWNPDGSNLTTANDMTSMLTAIYEGYAASKEHCDVMQHLLLSSHQTFLGLRLPKNTVVSNKVGFISDSYDGDDVHDVGVINDDYVLSVMCFKVGQKYRRETHAWQKRMREAVGHIINEEPAETFVHPGKRPGRQGYITAGSTIGILSKAIHDVYYFNEVRQ